MSGDCKILQKMLTPITILIIVSCGPIFFFGPLLFICLATALLHLEQRSIIQNPNRICQSFDGSSELAEL